MWANASTWTRARSDALAADLVCKIDKHFSRATDPRENRGTTYDQLEVIVMALTATLFGSQGWISSDSRRRLPSGSNDSSRWRKEFPATAPWALCLPGSTQGVSDRDTWLDGCVRKLFLGTVCSDRWKGGAWLAQHVGGPGPPCI